MNMRISCSDAVHIHCIHPGIKDTMRHDGLFKLHYEVTIFFQTPGCVHALKAHEVTLFAQLYEITGSTSMLSSEL